MAQRRQRPCIESQRVKNVKKRKGKTGEQEERENEGNGFYGREQGVSCSLSAAYELPYYGNNQRGPSSLSGRPRETDRSRRHKPVDQALKIPL